MTASATVGQRGIRAWNGLALLIIVGVGGLVAAASLGAVGDPTFDAPVFHFYIVTVTSFLAAVISLVLFEAVGQTDARAQLVSLAFVAVASFFTLHGMTTPGVIIEGFHPAVTWSAALSLLFGTGLLTLASLSPDSATHRLVRRSPAAVMMAYFSIFAAYVLLITGAPMLLTRLGDALPQLMNAMATITMGVAAIGIFLVGRRLLRGWHWLDGLVLVNLVLFLEAQASQLQPLWQLSWWMYHVFLLGAFVVSAGILAVRYEALSNFHLTRYFALTSAVLVALLGVAGGEAFVRLAAYPGDLGVPTIRARAIGISVILLGGLFVGLLFIVSRANDVIRRKTGELRQANDDLRRSEQLRGDLTAMVAHDLRSPLSSVILDLDLLRRVCGDDGSERILARARNSAHGLTQQIDDLLTAHRIEAGELTLVSEPVDLGELAASAVEALEPQLERRGLTLEVQVAPDLPPVTADAELLRRVLTNLVGNALKHSPSNGTVTVCVAPDSTSLAPDPTRLAPRDPASVAPDPPSLAPDSTSVAPDPTRLAPPDPATGEGDEFAVRVTVKDQGTGVPEEVREAIFEPYFQSPGEREARRGYGLGLAFCRLAVEAHRGRIWVDPDAPSSFIFCLPAGARVNAQA